MAKLIVTDPNILEHGIFETTTISDASVTATSEGTAETVASLSFTLNVATKCLVTLVIRTENSGAGNREFYFIQDTSTKINTSGGNAMETLEHTTSTANIGDTTSQTFVTESEPSGAHTYNVKSFVTAGTGTINNLMLQVVPLVGA